MSFKQKIESSPILWILGTLLTGFLAGIGVYKGIIEIAQLKVVPKHQTTIEKMSETKIMASKLYPRKDGLVADFKTGGGGPARTVLGEVLNVITDNEWNGTSKCWYKLMASDINQNGEKKNKFLRFYYQLEPREISGGESYVGFFTDFSPPPSKIFDISDFSGISLRIRFGQVVDIDSMSMYISLGSSNNLPIPGLYDFPTASIESHNIKEAFTDWIEIKIAFIDFSSPHFSNRNVSLDTTKVFRFTISLVSSSKKKEYGHIDIDDIRFY